MPDRTSHPPGTFCWAELATSDIDAAKPFYAALFKWVAHDEAIPGGGSYTTFEVRGREAAAGMTAPPEQGPPHWNAYVSVASADESAERAAQLGATVVASPFDVMTYGRMAVIHDPTGAFLNLWEAGSHIGATVVNEHGAMTWNDLATRDPEAAEAFYGEFLGFESSRVEEVPFPYWSISLDGRGNGGMRALTDETPAEMPPHWSTYFGVDDVDAACDTARAEGGQVLVEPVPAPTGRFAVLTDPQGAMFAVYEGEFED